MLPEKIIFKNKLKEFCRHIIEERIAAAKEIIHNTQESANQEEKSSAGDKYETGRAMGHLQKDMHTRQLSEYLKELAALHIINTGTLYDNACAGAYLETNEAYSFFIAAGIGRQIIDGRTIFFLSAQAPLARILQNKKKGDGFIFNQAALVITELY